MHAPTNTIQMLVYKMKSFIYNNKNEQLGLYHQKECISIFLLSKLFTAFSYINSYYRASSWCDVFYLRYQESCTIYLPILLSYRLLYKVRIIMPSTKHSPHKKTVTGLEASTGWYQNDMQCSIVRRKLKTKGKQLAV